MFRRHLHPSPLCLVHGLVLIGLWAGFWISLLTTLLPESQARALESLPAATRVAELSRTI
jgi:hypothetical protein